MTKSNIKLTSKWYYTLGRVLLFCLCCVVVLAFSSRVTQNVHLAIADHLSLLIATLLTFLLIILFLKWERLTINEAGIIPGKSSLPRFLFGYFAGMAMAATQALLVLAYGHFQLRRVPEISITEIFLPLLLYFLVACREELAFRSYPLRTLNISLGPVLALIIIAVVFILEHVAGGMTWGTAILGSGAGAFLFGVAALKTKGLALSLGLHSAWNFGQWMFGFKNRAGIWEAIVEKGYESEVERVGMAAFLFVMGVAITGVYFFYRKNSLREDG